MNNTDEHYMDNHWFSISEYALTSAAKYIDLLPMPQQPAGIIWIQDCSIAEIKKKL